MSGTPRPPPGPPPGPPAGAAPPRSGGAGFTPPRGVPRGAPMTPGRGSPAGPPLGGPPPRIQRPPGPPPEVVPLTATKPPPRAPPPNLLAQTAKRPPVDPTPSSKRPISAGSAREPKILKKDPNVAPPKANNFVTSPTKKAGAISMFEEADDAPAPAGPAEKKTPSGPPPGGPQAPGRPAPPRGPPTGGPRAPPPRPPGAATGAPPPGAPGAGGMMRTPRPLPPRTNPPGIPAGQPLPPGSRQGAAVKPPAPVKPPPRGAMGGRAPPPEEPDLEVRSSAAYKAPAPTTEPPLLRVKRPKTDETPLKRREKEMPEFESSDDDEENPSFVKQPLPFGVLKQDIPKSSLQLKQEEEKAKQIAQRSAKLMGQGTGDFMGTPPSHDFVTTRAATPGSAPESRAGTAESMVSTEGLREMDDSTGGGSSFRPQSAMSAALASVNLTDAPSDAVRDNRVSGFVPSAPPAAATGATVVESMDMDKHFDDSKLGATLSRGRLSVRCIEGHDIRRKDDQDYVPRNDPYIKFRLGAAERHPWKATEPKRKQNGNPQFEDELVYFDVLDPAQFIFQEDLQLCIELWNKSALKNELVGSVTMSVVRFFKLPFTSFTEKVPIYYPGATRTPMKLSLEFVFEEARSGLVQVTLYEASNLRNIDPMGQQDPYVQFSIGRHYKKKSKTIRGGGTAPYFEEEDVLLWLDQDNWVENLKVDVLDADAKEDKPIGSTEFSLLPYMKYHPDEAREDTYDLFYYVLVDPKDDTEKKEVACGEIVMRIRFMPAGKLKIYMDRAKDLALPETHKAVEGEVVRMDPYVNLTMEGKAVKMIKRTPADKDGGADPVWENEIKFEVVDQYLIDLQVFNQSVVGKDLEMGFAQISLLNVFRSGFTEYWLSLKQKKANGGIKEVGDIFIRMEFTGPVGISFPQFRPEMDTFDDALRKPVGPDVISSDDDEDDEGETKPVISTDPAAHDEDPEEELRKLKELEDRKQDGEKIAGEFKEEEIQAAFKFIDLDHNNFVGAAEIRHILVCMGEMITDEEIDCMISMVDMDGDGQVSYKEFRTLVLHPNPGLVDMHKEINKEKDAEIMKEKQALAGKTHGLDLTAFQRQKEITLREQKKKMIVAFVVDNEVDFNYIKNSHQRFLEVPPEKRPAGRIKFQEFCKVMDVEPIQEYKNLHSFYDTEEMGDMDIREFLLSMMNFVDVDKEVRIRLSFEMFDELQTGYIAQREVEEILKGNHMLSAMSVRRKAETIMRQANSNKAGSITMNEFVVVSKKFPNILLPAVGYTPTFKSTDVILN